METGQTEKTRQLLRKLLSERQAAGTRQIYNVQLANVAKLQSPTFDELFSDTAAPIPASASTSERKKWYLALVKVVLSPSLGGMLLKGFAPVLTASETPQGLEAATETFSKKALGTSHLGAALGFQEGKLAAELAVYLRDDLIPALRAVGGGKTYAGSVAAAEDYVLSAGTLPSPAPRPAPAPLPLPSPAIVSPEPLVSRPAPSLSLPSPSLPTKPTIIETPISLPGQLDARTWTMLVNEVLIRGLALFASQHKAEWADFWLGRQRNIEIAALSQADLLNRLPRDLAGPSAGSGDAVAALAQLYQAAFAALLLHWRYLPSCRVLLRQSLERLSRAASENAWFSESRLASDAQARLALEQSVRLGLISLRDCVTEQQATALA